MEFQGIDEGRWESDEGSRFISIWTSYPFYHIKEIIIYHLYQRYVPCYKSWMKVHFWLLFSQYVNSKKENLHF